MTILLPIGQDLGPIYDGSSSPDVFQVRLGTQTFGFSREEYALWRAPIEMGASAPTTVGAVVAAARQLGIDNPEQTFNQLVHDGFLVPLVPVGAKARDFADNYTLSPLARGLGNTPDDPATFHIHLGAGQALEVSWLVYYVWSMARQHPNLSHAIQTAWSEQQATKSNKSADAVIADFLQSLPLLLRHECTFLDVASHSRD